MLVARARGIKVLACVLLALCAAPGHTAESYAEPRLRRHLLGGIRWAAGR
jgi:hypothetical protein